MAQDEEIKVFSDPEYENIVNLEQEERRRRMPKLNVISGGKDGEGPWLSKLNVGDIFVCKRKSPTTDWSMMEFSVTYKIIEIMADGTENCTAVRLFSNLNGQMSMWSEPYRFSSQFDLVKVLGHVEPPAAEEQEKEPADGEGNRTE